MSETEPDGSKDEKNPLVVAGIVGALGMEFVGVGVGCLLIGQQLDERLEIGPWGTVVMMALGLVGAGWHCYLLSRKFLIEPGD